MGTGAGRPVGSFLLLATQARVFACSPASHSAPAGASPTCCPPVSLALHTTSWHVLLTLHVSWCCLCRYVTNLLSTSFPNLRPQQVQVRQGRGGGEVWWGRGGGEVLLVMQGWAGRVEV